MQSLALGIGAVTKADLLATGQRPKMILQIFVSPGPGWVDITNLAGNNYLKGISISSGGARMTPDPMAGQFSASINNEGNIFHPAHPTSPYSTYFRAGRKVRIWIGGTYVDAAVSAPGTLGKKYWQRMIGVMDEPEYDVEGQELVINGLDFMKVLSDMKFTKEFSTYVYTPIDNYWGTSTTHLTSASVNTYGLEMYAENDAMDTGAVGVEAENLTNWATSPAPGHGGPSKGVVGSTESNWAGEITLGWAPNNEFKNDDIGNVIAGRQYRVVFAYMNPSLSGTADVNIYESGAGGGIMGGVTCPYSAGYVYITFFFTATKTGTIRMTIENFPDGNEFDRWRIDEISVMEITGTSNTRYNMPLACTGIYYVELDGRAQWPGDQKGEGWYYDEVDKIFYFGDDKQMVAGKDLIVYYFTAQNAEWVMADILAKAGIRSTRTKALNAMGNPVTNISIYRVWFDAGSSYIDAVKKICERCNWRFYFKYDGTPAFVPAPTVGTPSFNFAPQNFSTHRLYQDRSEIWNKIMIEGEKVAELVGWQENMPSELKDEASDATSIALYGEHTKSINNHLFQDLGGITAMCITLLTAYKDPKWYFDFDTPYNAVPLELGDTVRLKALLDIALPHAQRYDYDIGFIRDINISDYNVTYKCQMEGEYMIELLASKAINLNEANDTKIDLYTVPDGRSCIITKVVERDHSAALATAKSEYGFNVAANDVITAVFKAITAGGDRYQIVVADDDAVRGAAGEVFKHCLNLKEGSALTCKVDVFGYLYWP